LAATADEVGQVWNAGVVWNAEMVAEIIPERKAEFGDGAHQTKECIATFASVVTASAATDFVLGDWQRMSRSEPLVCSGVSGRSSTINNSDLLAFNRSSKPSSVTNPVRRWKMRSKRGT
jgi:hypothetical protein